MGFHGSSPSIFRHKTQHSQFCTEETCCCICGWCSMNYETVVLRGEKEKKSTEKNILKNELTRELISTWATSFSHNKGLSPMVTFTRHASKHTVPHFVLQNFHQQRCLMFDTLQLATVCMWYRLKQSLFYFLGQCSGHHYGAFGCETSPPLSPGQGRRLVYLPLKITASCENRWGLTWPLYCCIIPHRILSAQC